MEQNKSNSNVTKNNYMKRFENQIPKFKIAFRKEGKKWIFMVYILIF